MAEQEIAKIQEKFQDIYNQYSVSIPLAKDLLKIISF